MIELRVGAWQEFHDCEYKPEATEGKVTVTEIDLSAGEVDLSEEAEEKDTKKIAPWLDPNAALRQMGQLGTRKEKEDHAREEQPSGEGESDNGGQHADGGDC